MAWYPLGRIVGGTVFPGIMYTAAAAYYLLHAFNITLQIRNVCVFIAPLFAGFTSLATYGLTSEVHSRSAGLLAAAFMAIAPGYISRSVAGSFDNEGVAIFALIFTYFLWVRALNTGSVWWTVMCALSFYYMVNAWGGYVFIINLVPLHVLALLVLGRFTSRAYVAYSTFFVLATLLAMQVHFINFQAVQSSEHMGSFGVFGIVQLYAGLQWVRTFLSPQQYRTFVRVSILSVTGAVALALIVATATGYIAPWTGRFWSLMDPTYASKNIPIIASVSEHQPTTWASYWFDLHMLMFFAPVGMWVCANNLTDGSVFVLLYAMTSIYFSGVMVRLMLVLAPILVIFSAIGMSVIIDRWMPYVAAAVAVHDDSKKRGSSSASSSAAGGSTSQREVAVARSWVSRLVVAGAFLFMLQFLFHCTWVAKEAYSSPSIILSAKQADGSRAIFDDFRESYRWINQNTAPDARIMSWWDYGYQLAVMSNRTVLVDNNTWNNTHIAQVGKAFASDEETAYKIMRRLDVDYVLIWFGGKSGYQSDDINKFLWMVRIAGSVDPTVVEQDYFSKEGRYSIGTDASPTMLKSLMYKLSYYRFAEPAHEMDHSAGYDRVRGAEIGDKNVKLKYLEEAYTTEHWLVRIYRVTGPKTI
jgi:dolichyl-diphosphooligosaccharide--protein glycosyltransferase